MVAGQCKATYGTGAFVLTHTGDDCAQPPFGLLRTTVAQPDAFALEGAVFIAGAALQWLRDGLGVIDSAAESEALARSVDSTAGVAFVPALTGLGSPWWDAEARGMISGITRGTTRAHLVRAGLEAIAHQVRDVIDAGGQPPSVIRADGGAVANRFLMQLQADLVGAPVEVSAELEMTGIGAAALAGIGAGVWNSAAEVAALHRSGERFEPNHGSRRRRRPPRRLAHRRQPGQRVNNGAWHRLFMPSASVRPPWISSSLTASGSCVIARPGSSTRSASRTRSRPS